MANSNFIVHNGLTVGPLTIDATTGDISTTGNISGVLNKISAGASNVTVTTSFVNVAIASTNVASFSASGIGGTLTTAAQTAITSVGTLASLATGAITTTGTLALNAAGGLTTSQTTFPLVNTTATTVNFAGAATTLTVGATTGTMSLNNANIWYPNATTLNGAQTSVDLLNVNATTVNFAGAATALTIGAATGTTTIRNAEVVVTGNLTVNGTTQTINSTTLVVNDKNVTLGNVGTPSNTTADGGGITLLGATSKTFNWVNATSAWTSSEHIDIASTKAYFIAGTSVLNATTLGSGVTGSSLTSFGTTPAMTSPAITTSITTPSTSFDAFNTTATTVNFAGAATAITIGATTGVANIRNANLYLPNATTIYSGQATVALLNVNATTINAFGAATTISMGSTTGKTTYNSTDQSTTTTSGAVQVNGGIGVAKDVHVGGMLHTTNTVSSTSTTTGAAVIDGGLGVAGTIFLGGTLTVNSGAAVTAIINGATTGVGNIGSSTVTFNTVFAKATTAQYADVAERYTADAHYVSGTIISFGGDAEVTISNIDTDSKIAGIITTNPAYLMNNTLTSEFIAEVALLGRVPCLVQGTVRKGDLMVSAGNGRARAEANPKVGSVIGKALANSEGDATIEVVVGRV